MPKAARIGDIGTDHSGYPSTPITAGSSTVKIAVYWLTNRQRNDWQPWTRRLQQQWVLLSQAEEGLKVGLPLYPEEVNTGHGIGIELHYKPLPDQDVHDVLRFQADSLKLTVTLPEVAILKVRDPRKDNLLPLTQESITQVPQERS